jgi:hypothetical protein
MTHPRAWNSPLPARSKPLEARTGLRPGGGLARPAAPASGVTLLRRTPLRQVSAKRAKENAERRAMLAAKYPGKPLCEVPFCIRWADDAHEPLTRARGGSITDPQNVRAVCRPHHNEITFEEPEWAYEIGFLVHSWDGDAA